jgi:hypothetical protein
MPTDQEKAMYLILHDWKRVATGWERVSNGIIRSLDSAFRFQQYLDHSRN